MVATTPIASLRYAEQTDAMIAETGFHNLASDLDNKLIPVYASTTARDAAIPSPTQGMFCYVTATAAGGRTLMGYTGSAWIPHFCSPLFAYKSSSETTSSSTTFQDDNDLVVSVEANTKYLIEMYGICIGDDTADLKYRFTFPASATLSGGQINLLNTVSGGASTAGDGDYRAFTTEVTPSSALNVGLADTNFVSALYKGVLIVGATAGTLRLQWAQINSVAVNTGLHANSYLRGERVV